MTKIRIIWKRALNFKDPDTNGTVTTNDDDIKKILVMGA